MPKYQLQRELNIEKGFYLSFSIAYFELIHVFLNHTRNETIFFI